MRRLGALAMVLVAACGGSDGATADSGTGSPDARSPDAAADAPVVPATATIRVHYPLGTHALTIRGSGGGLDWNAGAATSVSGDVATYTLPGLAAAVEWKPLLDDSTWARGPNYHLAPGATVDIYPHFTAVTGQVVTQIAAFHSAGLDDRPVYAYLPASYAENTDATYPVVYMHDGQNLWAALPDIAFSGTWNVDTAFDAAAEHGACSSSEAGAVAGWGAQPLGGTPTLCTGDADCGAGGTCVTFPEAIVIGVGNTANRIYELTPTTDPGTAGGGGADAYLNMLVTGIKPLIDAQLRTRPEPASTALAGSSLGGLVTAYAGVTHGDVFSRLGELSPSTWWNGDVIVGDVAAQQARAAVVYVDSGQGDVDDEADTDMLAQTYGSLGYTDGPSFRHVVQPGAAHSETYWAERLPGALQLLLGAR